MKKTDNRRMQENRMMEMPAIFLTFFKRNANEQHKNR